MTPIGVTGWLLLVICDYPKAKAASGLSSRSPPIRPAEANWAHKSLALASVGEQFARLAPKELA